MCPTHTSFIPIKIQPTLGILTENVSTLQKPQQCRAVATNIQFYYIAQCSRNCRKAATSTWWSVEGVCGTCACSEFNYNSKLVFNNIKCFNLYPQFFPLSFHPSPSLVHYFLNHLSVLSYVPVEKKNGREQKNKMVFHWVQTILIVVADCKKNTPNELNGIMETIAQWHTAPNTMKYAYSRPIIEIITKYEDLIKLLEGWKSVSLTLPFRFLLLFTTWHEVCGSTWTRAVRMCTKYGCFGLPSTRSTCMKVLRNRNEYFLIFQRSTERTPAQRSFFIFLLVISRSASIFIFVIIILSKFQFRFVDVTLV